MAFGRPKVVKTAKESSAEALGPGRTARKASRRPERVPICCLARVLAHFGVLSGDTRSDSGSMSGGIWTSKSGQGDKGKQCGGPGTSQDSQEGVQEARQDGNQGRFGAKEVPRGAEDPGINLEH